jgi:protein-L-isoaspartate(D-aspartate) O-methyltransferase
MELRIDFSREREKMVIEHLIGRGIRDSRILAAMQKIPRHLFVPDKWQNLAYADRPLPIENQQTISQPYIVALMTESLELREGDRVLEIGTGSGYQTAVLAELCDRVHSVEILPELLESASDLLNRLQYRNITAKVDDGTLGWPEHQPFDAIIVTAGAPHLPRPLLEQLAEGGRLVIPVGDSLSQALKKIVRRSDGFWEEQLLKCQFVPLRGEHGWQQ